MADNHHGRYRRRTRWTVGLAKLVATCLLIVAYAVVVIAVAVMVTAVMMMVIAVAVVAYSPPRNLPPTPAVDAGVC